MSLLGHISEHLSKILLGFRVSNIVHLIRYTGDMGRTLDHGQWDQSYVLQWRIPPLQVDIDAQKLCRYLTTFEGFQSDRFISTCSRKSKPLDSTVFLFTPTGRYWKDNRASSMLQVSLISSPSLMPPPKPVSSCSLGQVHTSMLRSLVEVSLVGVYCLSNLILQKSI